MSSLWPDTRAVTVQIGAVLLLGVVVLLMTVNQAAIVPSQNQNVEFSHNDRIQSDLLDFRNGLIRAATSGNTQPNSVELGTSFPSRLIAINPAPASGSLAPSSASGNATVSGAVPLDRNAREYWSNETHSMQYETKGFRYQPSYREYVTAPSTVYENTVLYNEFADGQNRTLSGQSIVDGRTISVIALQDVPTRSSSSTVGMDLRAISPSSTQVRTIAVTTDGEPLTIRLPTQLGAETWSELLDDEPYVDHENVSVTDGEVTIPLVEIRDGSEVTYNLRTSAVTASRSVERPEPAYVTVVDGANRSVPENTTNTLTAEVRDRYNNPVSGATVDAAFSDGTQSLSASQLRSTEQGFAPFSFETETDGSAQFSLVDQHQQATVSLSAFSAAENELALQSDQNQQRRSSSSGRVRFPYTASGSGSLTAAISSSTATVSAALNVYSVGSGQSEAEGAIRIDEDGDTVAVTHEDVHQVDYSDETLFVPDGESFGPEDGAENIEYTFKDYDIEGDINTDQRMSLTAVDGDINFSTESSAISGRQITFVAENGNINVDGATIETTAGDGGQGNEGIVFDSSGYISAVETTMESGNDITLTADSWIDLTDASLTVTGNGDIELTAGEYVDLVRTILDIQGTAGNIGASAEGTVIDDADIDLRGKASPLDKTETA